MLTIAPRFLEVSLVLVAVVLAVAAAGEEVEVVVLDQEPALVFADDAVVEAERLVPGIEMHLADGAGEVPGSRQHQGPGGQTCFGVIRTQELAVVGNPRLDRVQAGQQGDAGGHADRMRAVSLFVEHPFPRDAVDVRGTHERGAVTAEEVVAQLVGDDEQEIRSGRHGREGQVVLFASGRAER